MNNAEFIEDFNAVRPPQPYQLTDIIGTGGQARVYKGFEVIHKDVEVAVKVFHPNHQAQTDEELAAFTDEANRIKNLDGHPNIIPVLWQHTLALPRRRSGFLRRAGTTEPRPYLVMPYISGGTLGDRMRSLQLEGEPMPTPEVLSILGQTMMGMMHAHGEDRDVGEKLTHRDLKPDNLLRATDEEVAHITGLPDAKGVGVIKIADFGASTPGHINEHTITHTQVAIGTLPYMSPEQFTGKAVAGTDVRALAIIGWELLTGSLPVTPDTAGNPGAAHAMIPWYLAHQDHKVGSLEAARPEKYGIDPIIQAIQESLYKALQPDTANRYKTMGAWFEDFTTAAAKGLATIQRNATLIDLKPRSPDHFSGDLLDVGNSSQTTTSDTQLLTAHYPTQQATEVLPEDPRRGLSRRSFLSLPALALVLSSGADTLRPAEQNTPKSAEIIDKERYAAARLGDKVLTMLEMTDNAEQAEQLAEHLLLIEAPVMAIKIEEMQKAGRESTAWLVAKLSFYYPEAAIRLMNDYKQKGQYKEMAIVAASLATVASGDDLVVAGIANQAVTAIRTFCVDQKLEDHSNLISLMYPWTYFESKTDPLVKQRLSNGFQTAKTYWALKAQSVARSADDTNSATGLARAYDEWLAKGNTETEAYDLVLSAYKALIPFNVSAAVEELQRLTDGTRPGIADETAQTLALEIAPYDPEAAINYINSHSHEPFSTQMVILALATAKPEFVRKYALTAEEPFKTWIAVALDPLDDKKVDAALQQLASNKELLATHGATLAGAIVLAHLPK